jgi:predicted PurR-regulated permease PerM
VISASVNGVIVIALIQGTLGGLMFAVLGVPSPLLWGVIMTVLSMIPMVGSGVVWLPTAVVFLVTGHWAKAAILAAWGVLAIGTVDNFLRPRLVGGRTQMHPLLIFFAVLGGLQVFGIVGLLLGPVVVAITMALLAVFREANVGREQAGAG